MADWNHNVASDDDDSAQAHQVDMGGLTKVGCRRGLNPRGEAGMTIELKPEQQRTIDLAIQSGAYQDPEEVLDQAFEIIREQLELQDWMIAQRAR